MSEYQIQLQVLDDDGKSQKLYPINTALDTIVGLVEPSLLLSLPGEKEDETLASSLSYIKAYLQNLENVASVKRSISSSTTLDDTTTLASSKAVYTVQEALTKANSEIVNIQNKYAIKNHADALKTYGIGTSLLYGHVKVSDTYDSQVRGGNAENGVSASQNALYRVYDTLITKTNSIINDFKEHVNTSASNETSGHVTIGDNITLSNGKISLGKEDVSGALGYTPMQSSDLTQGEGISISGTKITNSGVRSIAEGSTNGTISTNINGTTKDIIVHGLKSAAYTDADDYADVTHYHDSIDQTYDHRTTATTPNDYNGKLKNVGLKESSVIGSPDASTFAGVIGYRGYANSNGGVANEFAFTSLGKLFRRTGATTTWNPWLEMIDSGNISKYAPSLTGTGASGNWEINAATATKLSTARNLTIGSAGKTFDGSADVSWTLTEIGAAEVSHSHTKSQITDLSKELASEDLDTIKTVGFYYAGSNNTVTNKPSGVDAFGLEVIQSAIGWYTQILYASNNVQNSYRRWFNGSSWTSWTEDKLTDTNTVTTATTTGSGNAVTSITAIDGALTVTKDSTFLTAHPTISTSTDSTSTAFPSTGGTFTAVDSVTRDSNGHVTGINTKTVTLPNTAVVVDSSLSSTSTNPVQNKIVNEELSKKASSDTLGRVKLTDSTAVTDSEGLALPATEKNASIEGTLAYQIDKLNSSLSNNFGTAKVITIGTDYTCPSDGIVRVGGYGRSAASLLINGNHITEIYGGNQAIIAVYNSWRVRKGDIVRIESINSDATAQLNVHHFVPYA